MEGRNYPALERLWVFNPDHEMAIADGSRYYTPPANIVRMAEDLAYLPAYFSEAGDGVWMNKPLPAGFTESRERLFGLQPVWVDDEAMEQIRVRQPEPWGWSPKMCFLLRKQHAPVWQEKWKALYSRRTARLCLEELCTHLPFVEKEVIPVECGSVEEVKNAANGRFCMIKAPWSSSGKGILSITEEGITAKSGEWLKGMLRRQGYLMVEKKLQKVTDFAMEFYSGCTGVEFIGLSYFTTGEKGEYTGNYIGSQQKIEDSLKEQIKGEELEQVKTCLTEVLNRRIHSWYKGYLGVDMMVYRDPGEELRIQPCVEINLRYTMGILALFLSRRFVSEESEGIFTVSHYVAPGEAEAELEALQQQYPLMMDGKRIRSGYLALTPVDTETRFVAAIKAVSRQ